MIKFSWDLANRRIMSDYVSRVTISSLDLILRDIYESELVIVGPSSDETTTYEVSDVPADRSIIFTVKKADALDDDPLVRQAAWVGSGTGDDRKYTADLDMGTSELIAAFGTASSLTLKAEFTLLRASDSKHEASTQFTIVIYPDVARDEDGVPTSQFPVIAQYTDESGVHGVRLVNAEGTAVGLFKNGSPYVFCAETGLWYPITITIVDGVPTVGTGAGEAI